MKKILLIEDNADIRENTAEILELTNYRVFTAENGKVGVELALREKPDLIVCDIMMPVLDGYGVLHMLKKNDATKNTAFIFLSAKSDRTDFRKGMELGADDYISKPFTETELLNAIESRLKKAAQVNADLTNEKPAPGNEISVADTIRDLVSNRDINKYKKKQVVFNEGNRPSCLYYIQKGKIKTYKSNEDGKELVVDLYHEGDFLGYVALFENNNYRETAEAMEDSELAVIPKEDFESFIYQSPSISRKFIQMLAMNISEKETHLINLAYNSLRKKVADSLLRIYKKYNRVHENNFPIALSRENLASVAGTATESLIRTLSDFKNERLIDIKEGIIIILNEKKLENLAN